MQVAPDFVPAVCAAAVLAAAAKALRTVTWSGAAAGLVTGAAVAAGFGVAGLVVLGTFFVVASAATKVGYAAKSARGAAEKRGGARGWENVAGKGGVAALVCALHATGTAIPGGAAAAFAGAVAAAIADTLGTEIGTLARGAPRSLPLFRSVPAGTPGAVSVAGTLAGAAGAALVAAAALAMLSLSPSRAVAVGASGIVASAAESLAVGLGLRAPGFVRNILTTAVGAALPAVLPGSPS